MKTRDFERILVDSGFQLIRNSDHRIWSNGVKRVAIPQSKNINKMIVRRILKDINYSGSVPEVNFG